jgi:hypothetical protein
MWRKQASEYRIIGLSFLQRTVSYEALHQIHGLTVIAFYDKTEHRDRAQSALSVHYDRAEQASSFRATSESISKQIGKSEAQEEKS